jgi:Predicted phage phi-C31 gp36 major capsid-like protein
MTTLNKIAEKQTDLQERTMDILERLAYRQSRQGPPEGLYPDGVLTESDHSGGSRTPGPRPFKNLGEQMLAIRSAFTPGERADDKLFEVGEGRAMTEGSGAAGGFMLQDNFSNQLLGSVFSDPDVLGKVNKMSITKGNNMKIPAINETSRADGSRGGGVQMYWGAEGALKVESQAALRLLELQAKKLIGLIYATDELLEDASALENYIRRAFQAEMRFKLLDSLINGNGAGQPLGILASPCLVTQAIETGQANATIDYANVIKMWSRFVGDYSKAVWHINPDCWPQLLDMGLTIGFGGSPVLMPPSGNSPYTRLLGCPIIPLEHCKTLGTKGDIFLCDWSKYIAIDRGPMQSAASIHIKFEYDTSVFRFVYRFDGQPELASAITPYSGSANTLSPFVTLAGRP